MTHDFKSNGFSFKEQALAIIALLLIVGVIGWFLPGGGSVQVPFLGTGAPNVEDYDPNVMQNGLNTNKAVSFGSTLAVTGATTLSSTVAASGAVSLTSTFKLGSSGTAQANQVITTCNPTANTSIAATSTGYIFCTGVTGITSSDYVFAGFSTSTNAIADQWVIVGAKASTTAAAVDIKIMNLTGTAAVPSAASTVASSTRIFGIH